MKNNALALKEKWKGMGYNIDVLTFSATPDSTDPSMSLVGVREMSISTPPEDRLPVQTYG